MLDEPGRDTSKFDTIMPTVVRPVTRETFMIGSDSGDVSNVRGCIRVFGGGEVLRPKLGKLSPQQ